MDKFTTDRETDARSTRRARGNSFEPRNAAPASVCTRVCEVCGTDITHRRRQCRTCGPGCRGRLFDARHGRQKHVDEGKRPRRRALEV